MGGAYSARQPIVCTVAAWSDSKHALKSPKFESFSKACTSWIDALEEDSRTMQASNN